MLDTADSGHLKHHSALIAHELSRLDINIAALSEGHLHEEGSFKEYGASYTLYWSGKPKTESHLSGVGFMIKNSITSKLENMLTGHSDRIMSLRLPLHNKQHVLFCIYASTLQADPAEKDKFYTFLRHLPQKVPAVQTILEGADIDSVGCGGNFWQILTEATLAAATLTLTHKPNTGRES
ncbi:hypothetical protein WISP_148785 [Willisornis vidua]|uniref:Uncharacterized protein n=1 Tax=Willisornis vidua TaxID=1566151 RepID=A0ABQ9CPN3_9PASS|nr:hypothetical protein WISP_148785 [Willisornis vidua]